MNITTRPLPFVASLTVSACLAVISLPAAAQTATTKPA